MANPKPEWFLAPRDVAPGTSITLGQLIADPFAPEGPPYLAPALPIPPKNRTEFKYPWTQELERGRGGNVGIFASFLAPIGAGADLSGNWATGDVVSVAVEQLQTLKAKTTDEYVLASLKLPENAEYIKESKSVYIVSGVKTAFQARIKTSRTREWGVDANASISPGVQGLETGVKGGLNRLKKDTEEIGAPIDFVYAFRLNKVHYSWRRHKPVTKSFTEGATFSKDDENPPPKKQEPVESHNDPGRDDLSLELIGIEEDDAGADEFGVEGQPAFDEVERGDCVLVKPPGAELHNK